MENTEKETLFDILDESVKNLNNIKSARKGLKETISNIVDATGAESGFVKEAIKITSRLGDGVINPERPLGLEAEAKEKDPVSKLLLNLAEIIQCLKVTKTANKLKPYFEQLKDEYGIIIALTDASELNEVDEDINESFVSAKAYNKTIKDYREEIKEEHATKADDANFVRARDYSKVLNIYNTGVSKGLEAVEDKCQDTLASCEETKRNVDILETAVNAVQDKISSI